MSKQRFSEDTAIRVLSKKHDVEINPNRRELKIKHAKNPGKVWDLGNKAWGKVDFLVHHCGYTKIFV